VLNLLRAPCTRKREGVATVSPNVAEINPRAKVHYERFGFVVKGKQVGKLSSKYGRGVGHEYMEINLLRRVYVRH
jgi:hypothetical protein